MAVSQSVWFEQVDEALLKLIKEYVCLPDSGGVRCPVYTQVRKPDEDFKVETYPAVSIYNLYSSLDKERYVDGWVPVLKDTDNAEIIMEKTAIPYDLYYQLDFWAKYQSDMNEMTRLWLGNTGRYFNLAVTDMSGVKRSCYASNTDSLTKLDVFSGTERIFHSSLTYKIWVELDESIRETKSMIITTDSRVIKTN